MGGLLLTMFANPAMLRNLYLMLRRVVVGQGTKCLHAMARNALWRRWALGTATRLRVLEHDAATRVKGVGCLTESLDEQVHSQTENPTTRGFLHSNSDLT